MGKNGGYQVLNLGWKPLVLGETAKVEGIRDSLKGSNGKAILISGFQINGLRNQDFFLKLEGSNGNYTATEGSYSFAINSEQETITVTLARGGGGGGEGEDGVTFIPYVSPDGVISWSNDGGLPNPQPVNIKGPQGVKGDAGPTGLAGATGPRGATGDAGATGPQGPRGLQGLPGEPGQPGERGQKGDKGDTGPAGPQGETGPEGPQGKQGLRGERGYPGQDATINGVTTLTIEQGQNIILTQDGNKLIISAVGGGGGEGGIYVPSISEDGIISWTNNAGLPNPEARSILGPTGPQGPVGETGPAGESGPAGETGPQGPGGETGPQGPAGPAGETGPRGPAGPAGERGPAGEQGPAGETGPQGPIGETGPAGEQGPRGLTGPQGTPGANATINGYNTLNILEGENIQLSQSGSNLTISATGGGGGGGLTVLSDDNFIVLDLEGQEIDICPSSYTSMSAAVNAGVIRSKNFPAYGSTTPFQTYFGPTKILQKISIVKNFKVQWREGSPYYYQNMMITSFDAPVVYFKDDFTWDPTSYASANIYAGITFLVRDSNTAPPLRVYIFGVFSSGSNKNLYFCVRKQ